MTLDRKKPAGIVIILIYSAFNGVLLGLIGLLFMLASAIPDIPIWISVFSIVLVFFGILFLASVYGLWTLQSWGWNLTFWLYIVSIPLGIAAIFPIFPESEMSVGNTMLQLIGIGIDIAIILYLKKNELRNLYEI